MQPRCIGCTLSQKIGSHIRHLAAPRINRELRAINGCVALLVPDLMAVMTLRLKHNRFCSAFSPLELPGAALFSHL